MVLFKHKSKSAYKSVLFLLLPPFLPWIDTIKQRMENIMREKKEIPNKFGKNPTKTITIERRKTGNHDKCERKKKFWRVNKKQIKIK
jgi:hypothetical protein